MSDDTSSAIAAPGRRLTVLIPVYNEAATVDELLSRVEEQAAHVSELVIVDDASTDATADILANRTMAIRTCVIQHEVNQGKGAAIRTGLTAASGDLLLIQDADLEYSPSDYPALLAPFDHPETTVVYGSRSFGGHAAYSFWFVMGNRLVTLATNVLFNSYITDMETCFKAMPLETWRSLDLRANRFGIEPEITGKLLRRGYRIFEVPVSYRARARHQGKKLTWRDGVRALGVLLAVRLGTWPSSSGRN